MGAPGAERRRGRRGPGLLLLLPAGSSGEYLPGTRLQGHLRPAALAGFPPRTALNSAFASGRAGAAVRGVIAHP